MKRRIISISLICLLLLTGCGREKNPWQVDTVVRIPVDPTDAPTAAVQMEETAAPTETQAPTEAAEPPAATETVPETTGRKPSGTKKPTSGRKPEATQPAKATEPVPTEAPETQPATEAAAQTPYDPSDYSVGSLEKAILEEMNAYRAEAELPELSMSRRLCGIAALRAEEAVELWSHTRPDGRSYTTAMTDYDYGFSTAEELLIHVSGSGDAEAIVAKWMDTNGSKIVSEQYTTAGVAVCRTGGTTVAAVLLIG